MGCSAVSILIIEILIEILF